MRRAIYRTRRAMTPLPGGWVIVLTFVAALLLGLIPYPQSLKYARPDWVTLVLFYWCLALPNRVGVGYGWLVGLLMDLLHYTLFGQHAIGKALVALVATGSYQRLRLYPIWQQCAVLLLISTADIAIVGWVFQLTDGAPMHPAHWQSALTTALFWPPVYLLLRYFRRASGMTRR